MTAQVARIDQAPSAALAQIPIDREAVLRALGLDPRKPEVQALVLTCQQYGLDPVLKHMVLIKDAPYVTHKGLWHIAHESGKLDGHDVVESGETSSEWWAKVSIWRKDMGRPFTMTGRYPKSGTNKAHGPEMAVTRAECLVLRRMFDVSAPVQEEQDWDAPADALPVASTPPQSHGRDLLDELKAIAGTPRAESIKAHAAGVGKRLTAQAFDADPHWLQEVAQLLNSAPATDVIDVDPETGEILGADAEDPFVLAVSMTDDVPQPGRHIHKAGW